MANNGSAELKPGSPPQARRRRKTLPRREGCPAGAGRPILRIIYSADRVPSADRVREPSLDMTRQPFRRPDGPAGMLDRTVQAQIGRLLRDIFADVAAEPVPRRFIELLAALDLEEKCR
jgi:hypothetical protein